MRETVKAPADHAADRARVEGNDAFRRGHFREALKHYSSALALRPAGDAALYSNRSAALLALGLHEEALADATRCVELRPAWWKAHYRLGLAHLKLQEWSAAQCALQEACRLDGSNPSASNKLQEAEHLLRVEHSRLSAQRSLEARRLARQLDAAREADRCAELVRQWRSSGAGPDWDAPETGWRPTFRPQQRLVRVEQPCDEARRLAPYVNALADLAAPKAVLRAVADSARIDGVRCLLDASLAQWKQQQPSAPHVLLLGSAGGALAALAASRGACTVSAIERSASLHRMAQQVLQHQQGLGAAVTVVDRPLECCWTHGGQPPQAALEAAAALAVAGAPPELRREREMLLQAPIASRADIVMATELLDHSVLGLRLLPSLEHAAHHLLAPGALVVPGVVQVHGALVELPTLRDVAGGFDLSELAARYRWWPGALMRTDLRGGAPFAMLSAPFCLLELDLQGVVDAAVPLPGEEDNVFCSDEDGSSSSGSGGGKPLQCAWEYDELVDVGVTGSGTWNAVVVWFGIGQELGAPAALLSWAAPQQAAAVAGECEGRQAEAQAVAWSWGQGLQHVDGTAVHKGNSVQLRVRHDRGALVLAAQSVSGRPCDAPRPRHSLVPRWHFDMVLDSQRNAAYDAAIQRAVARLDGGGSSACVLDMGAGTGLLAMMAGRAGARHVVAAEVLASMADVCQATVAANGMAARVAVVNGDVRRLRAGPQPGGSQGELPARGADLIVFEVFDCGLLGEGALHLAAHASQHLMAPGARLLPCGARVWCQLLQLDRLESVAGGAADVSAANRWHWRPDYEGVELGGCRERWVALSEPQLLCNFDFADWKVNLQPAEGRVHVPVVAAGVANALALFFDLQLDDKAVISTSPHTSKGATWPQAIFWVQEQRVAPGDEARIAWRHDTYSFQLELLPPPQMERGEQEGGGYGQPTGVPLKDEAWLASYERWSSYNTELVSAAAQDPLRYRSLAVAAASLAARPHDHGVDAEQAAALCAKLM